MKNRSFISKPLIRLQITPQPKPFLNFTLGKMTVEEIGEDFTQDDLISDDVMILDGGNNIYVWIGKGSNADERKHAPE